MALHAVTIFLGSFLLFQVQPLIGRYILPWFGGSPAVWTTCMLFFQALLLAGYAYAHGATLLSRRRQVVLHVVLLVASLWFLPITPDAAVWKPSPSDPPIQAILLLLAATVGMPYLLLSASAPLVQHWFVSDVPGASPYRLYALSNAGSLLALVSYPFLVEPHLTLHLQATLWSWGFALYAVICAITAGWPLVAHKGEAAADAHDTASAEVPKTPFPLADMGLWISLSACGSALLLATTNQLCQEVAVVPFLWILPLAIYLVTFILCFRTEKGYDRVLWGMLFAAAIGFACRTLALGMNAGLSAQVLVFLAALFVGCIICHGELVRLRPEPSRLTAFYLSISVGGFVGGILVGIAAPAFFTGFWEYPVSWCLTAVTVTLAWWRGGVFSTTRWLAPASAVGLALLAVFTYKHITAENPHTITATRNFYGVLRVTRINSPAGEMSALMHGRVMHGSQFTDKNKRRTPTAYFTKTSGVGLAFLHHPRRGTPLDIGIIGLGAGTLAPYGRTGDTIRFYEINPAVVTFAREHFHYLNDSAAEVETVVGDARIMMETEVRRGASADYDILVVDAFSSDAIPVHLLTRECFELYRRRLQPGGLLAIHITNRFLDLAPVVHALGKDAGFQVGLISSEGNDKKGESHSDWMILSDNSLFFTNPTVQPRLRPLPPPSTHPWTDDYASMWPLLK